MSDFKPGDIVSSDQHDGRWQLLRLSSGELSRYWLAVPSPMALGDKVYVLDTTYLKPWREPLTAEFECEWNIFEDANGDEHVVSWGPSNVALFSTLYKFLKKRTRVKIEEIL